MLSPIFARAELAEAARQAEEAALALLAPDASAHDALVALAIATAQRVQQQDVLALPYRAWVQLVEFLACDPAYEPTSHFPYNKWDLMTAWLMPREEDSCFGLDVDRPDWPVSAAVPGDVGNRGLCALRAGSDNAQGSPAAAMAGECAGDC